MHATDQRSTARQAMTALQNWLWAGRWVISSLLLIFLMRGFIRHSAALGMSGLVRDLTNISPFYAADMPLVTVVMFAHMVAGAVLTVLAPLQLLAPIRRRWPVAHRWGGRIMVALGLMAGIGGAAYAIAHGTTGGPFMDVSSTVYGAMMIIAAGQTYRTGRARRWADHRRWGWRFSVLVIASWLYRIHYVVWDAMTGGLGVTDDMTGPFDKFQAWAFYLSYAIMLEVYFVYERNRKRKPRPAKDNFSAYWARTKAQ